tara:strand:+ start:1929 stop:2702 length:774 start_codon:yes stop_codon:yes gene_type:complete
MEVVDMKRGTFNAIREKQQVDKYECENTYTLYINNHDDPSYVDNGNTDHDKFSVFINPIGKEHIRNARCRLLFVGLPLQASETYGYGYVRSSITKNAIIGGALSTGCLGAFKIQECRKLDIGDNNIPILSTDAAIINQGNAPALEDAANSNTGAYNSFDANAPLGILPANSAALPRVSRAAYVEKYFGEDVVACVGNPISNNWISSDNPFGKVLDFEMMGEEISTQLQSGTAAGERISLVLEVQLLPDNQANDRFTN